MKKDITTKEILEFITEDIAFYLLGLNVTEIEFVDKELKVIEKREADLVACCKIEGIQSILHIEIQNSNDKDMCLRMLRYYTQIKTKFSSLPTYQFVIYIGKDNLTMANSIITDKLNFSYTIIDMHTIDCDSFIKIDTPESLILSVLCDFKDKNETDVLFFILKRLKELCKDDEYIFGKYTLALETLSENRNLKDKLKEVEDMLRTISLEQLPSYELGFERGIERGIERGFEKGELKAKVEIIKMLLSLGDSIEKISKATNLSIEEIKNLINAR